MLLGYSRGLMSVRVIAAACRTNALFIMLSGDSALHVMTVPGRLRKTGVNQCFITVPGDRTS